MSHKMSHKSSFPLIVSGEVQNALGTPSMSRSRKKGGRGAKERGRCRRSDGAGDEERVSLILTNGRVPLDASLVELQLTFDSGVTERFHLVLRRALAKADLACLNDITVAGARTPVYIGSHVVDATGLVIAHSAPPVLEMERKADTRYFMVEISEYRREIFEFLASEFSTRGVARYSIIYHRYRHWLIVAIYVTALVRVMVRIEALAMQHQTTTTIRAGLPPFLRTFEDDAWITFGHHLPARAPQTLQPQLSIHPVLHNERIDTIVPGMRDHIMATTDLKDDLERTLLSYYGFAVE